MAASLRVQQKSTWKSIHIPEDIIYNEDFNGLVDIQELTDYELMPYNGADLSDDEPSPKSKSKKGKRKRDKENAELAVDVDADEGSPLRKKKKKQPVHDSLHKPRLSHNSQTCQSISHIKEDSSSALVAKQKVKKKQKKSKNKNTNQSKEGDNNVFLKSDNILIINGDEESEHSVLDEGKKDRFQQKSKDRAHEKTAKINLSKSNSLHDLERSQSENVTATDLQTSKRKKKKRRKKHKVQNLQVGDSSLNISQTRNATSERVNEEEQEQLSAVKKTDLDMSQWKNLFVPDVLLRALQGQGFDTPTTIQSMALPSAIRDRKDILGAAETGSGKTLAFGIPVLTRILNYSQQQRLQKESQSSDQEEEMSTEDKVEKGTDENSHKVKSKKVSRDNPPMALILEPTRELAVQVKKHLMGLAKYTDIKLATVVGGMSIEKQRRLLGKHPQVVIATPGRLWQLIEEGNDHLIQVDKVLCLVVDEADRMVEKGHYEELTKILEMLNKSPRRVKNRQTFVMSATLTMDVGAPKRLMKKKMKNIIKDDDKLKMLTEKICVGLKPKVIDLTPKDKVAQTLTELRVNCNADEKDFYLYYFLSEHPGRTLVFANSKDCLRRLVSLLTLLRCSPLPLHADMHQRQRLKNLDKFAENSRGLLVASDVAARGLDIPKVDHVIHYQVPRTMENYVHRSGRTARASNLGLSVMFVGSEDAKNYRKIVYGVRNGEELSPLPVQIDLMPAVKMRVALARDIDVKEYRNKKKRLRNNFFTKAAQEMDMIIDDVNLLEEMGDSMEQAQNKQQLKQMKAQLNLMLQGSLTPLRRSKYPTKSGQLEVKKAVNLYSVS